MRIDLSRREFGEQLKTFDLSAFRLELQPAYREPVEAEAVARFLAGKAELPTKIGSLRAWFEQVADLTLAGRTVRRVRVHEDPPTPYQRWERWVGTWNTQAGEEIRYMTRAEAHRVGLLPAAGDTDWWLLDSDRLIVMTFDGKGHRIKTELVTDDTMVKRVPCGSGSRHPQPLLRPSFTNVGDVPLRKFLRGRAGGAAGGALGGAAGGDRLRPRGGPVGGGADPRRHPVHGRARHVPATLTGLVADGTTMRDVAGAGATAVR
jgi:hypothetical protein